MNIRELIEKLEALEAEHGNLPCETWNVATDRVPQRSPEVAYRKILVGRQTKPGFWSNFNAISQRGEKVVRL